MATQDVSQDMRNERAAVDRTGDRGGSIGMVLAVALLLVGSVIAFLFVGRANAQPYVLTLLSALAVIGVFSLFAGAAGIIRLAGRDTRDTFLDALTDGASDGIVVTDDKRRVVYANPAYLKLVDAVDADDIRPVERVFIGDPGVSEAIFRLAKASREGRQLQEEVRVPGLNGGAARWLRFRVRPLQQSGAYARWTAWSITDVSRDRERHENFFVEMRDTIDFLDHAPAGFFSVDPDGNVSYINATLAGWLDHDLAHVGTGGLKLADIVVGDGAALLAPVTGEPGDVKTETHDIDLKTRGGRTVPVRLYHKVAFAADGTPGASRTLVLNRAREDVADPARAAEVRFVRFFHNTPMAIATVDKAGKIARANAPFVRLQYGVTKGDAQPAEGRSILTVVAEPDRAALEAAIAQGCGRAGRYRAGRWRARGRGEPLGAVLRVGGRRERAGRRGRDRLHDRDHGSARAGKAGRAGAEDGHGRPAGRRHRARFQQRALRHHDGDRLPAQRAQADRPLVRRHHADQAEREPRREPGAASAGVLAPPDLAAAGARFRRDAVRSRHAAASACSARRSSSCRCMGAICGR